MNQLSQELLISPSRLRDASIPFVRMVQYPGEMVINFPGAYHSGFNSGKHQICCVLSPSASCKGKLACLQPDPGVEQ